MVGVCNSNFLVLSYCDEFFEFDPLQYYYLALVYRLFMEILPHYNRDIYPDNKYCRLFILLLM